MRRDLVLGGVIFAASATAVVDVYGESTARIVQKKERFQDVDTRRGKRAPMRRKKNSLKKRKIHPGD
jgi:hypothetical protein